MNELSSYWTWAIFGVILFIAESFSGAFYLLGLGIAAILVSIFDSAFNLSFLNQILLFALLSPICMFFVIKKAKQNKTISNIGQSSDVSIGTIGKVIENNSENIGVIEFKVAVMGSKKWSFIAEETIPENSKAKIVRVEGNYLFVEKVL